MVCTSDVDVDVNRPSPYTWNRRRWWRSHMVYSKKIVRTKSLNSGISVTPFFSTFSHMSAEMSPLPELGKGALAWIKMTTSNHTTSSHEEFEALSQVWPIYPCSISSSIHRRERGPFLLITLCRRKNCQLVGLSVQTDAFNYLHWVAVKRHQSTLTFGLNIDFPAYYFV
jgi:hypothetical protein